MFYDYPLTVPAGTAKNALVKYTLKLAYGIITHVYIEFPAGCRGLVYCALDWEDHQVYPTNPSGAFNSDNHVIPIEDYFPLLVAPYQLYARVWAPDTTYSHTLTARIEVRDPDELFKEAELPASLQKVVTFLGGTPTEEVEVEEAPVCTVGETKCEGYDLYECQDIAGTPAWVLKEVNAESCGYTPPIEVEPVPVEPAVGETKCEDYDLYEYQELEEGKDWVLKERNSTVCGYTAPPKRGTIEEAQLEIDAKVNLSAFHQGLIDEFAGSLSEKKRDKMEQWIGWRYLPDEMDAAMLAEWKKSYYYSTPYFQYCIRYPTYDKGPLLYYAKAISDYAAVFEEELAQLEEGGVL